MSISAAATSNFALSQRVMLEDVECLDRALSRRASKISIHVFTLFTLYGYGIW